MVKNPEVHRLILEWFKKNAGNLEETDNIDDVVYLNDELLMEYWENAGEIISEFNKYGGGPFEDEERAYDWLYKISDLVEEGNVSTAAKIEFLDLAFEEYDAGNSGFDDGLMDIFFDICQTPEEWKYLVKKLEKHPSDWRKELVIRIQKDHLHDDEAYLDERMKNLRDGSDYWDLTEFYIKNGNRPKALETAEQGILKAEGWVTNLLNFLFDHFAKAEDHENLERIVRTAIARKTEEKNMLDKLSNYYMAQGDYEKAKEALLESYEFLRRGYYEEYKRMESVLNDSDWDVIEPKVFERIRDGDLNSYLKICLDKNMKKTVLDVILNPPWGKPGFVAKADFDYFADKLEEDFPAEIIEYYWKKARNNIFEGNRKTYRISANYLSKVKHIYLKILHDYNTWTQRFSGLKAEFNNRPAFLDEVSEL